MVGSHAPFLPRKRTHSLAICFIELVQFHCATATCGELYRGGCCCYCCPLFSKHIGSYVRAIIQNYVDHSNSTTYIFFCFSFLHSDSVVVLYSIESQINVCHLVVTDKLSKINNHLKIDVRYVVQFHSPDWQFKQRRSQKRLLMRQQFTESIKNHLNRNRRGNEMY